MIYRFSCAIKILWRKPHFEIQKLMFLHDFEICQNRSRNSIFYFFIRLLVPPILEHFLIKLARWNFAFSSSTAFPRIFFFWETTEKKNLDRFSTYRLMDTGVCLLFERLLIKLARWNFACSLLTVLPIRLYGERLPFFVSQIYCFFRSFKIRIDLILYLRPRLRSFAELRKWLSIAVELLNVDCNHCMFRKYWTTPILKAF